MLAFILYFLSNKSTGISLILLVNIGLALMVYAGIVDPSILVINIIFSIIILYIFLKAKMGV